MYNKIVFEVPNVCILVMLIVFLFSNHPLGTLESLSLSFGFWLTLVWEVTYVLCDFNISLT